MPPAVRRRVDVLALIGGIVMLVDSLWGGIAALGLDLSRTNELVLAISFVLGFPAYLLDLWLNRRVAILMAVLFLFRWIATCFGGPTQLLVDPLRGNVLLILAFVLLQSSKLRREGQVRQTARTPNSEA